MDPQDGPRLDPAKIIAAFQSGKTRTEIANEFGCSRSTVHYHLRDLKPRPAVASPPTNGATTNGHGSDVAVLLALIDQSWARMPLAAKLEMLLSRAARES